MFDLFRKTIAARDLKPWTKVKIHNQIATVSGVRWCDGVSAPRHLIGSKALKTACALDIKFMERDPIKLHPGEKVILA